MFKIESYITPVILSYVEKYVKNFKPEQSQVSLWGGDASFQNLDLRLEVLEEQLNLPFTFVSGHIHELLIHVPWVKITSEPIVVTINTIECILNLKDQGQAERSTSTHQAASLKAPQEESPPGYIKSIVTRVINNITINCNNLILKYVEEDIVLSVNVRFLSMQTVNESWEPAFADVSSSEIALRKIVIVEDLTLCLDKMDTAGKIETYQDPVLYRCSMLIRLMMNYHSNVTKPASLTRFDLHCEKMEFSMTEQQLPMLLRLITLITSLQTTGQSGARGGDRPSHAPDERGDVSQEDEDRERGIATEGPGWSGWAWNTVTSFLPVDWDPDWSEDQPISSTGHVIHMGVYIDEAVLTFKTVETVQEQLFYKSRKIRYNSFLTLRVTSAVMSMLIRGVYMNNLRFGLGSIRLQPQGVCSCGHQEVPDGGQPPIYVAAGAALQEYLKDSLFDKNGIETMNWKNYYSEYDIDRHLATVTVTSMLEKSPAFGMDIIHSIDIPDEFPDDKLLEFESNFEYSNFPERKVTRYVVGDLKVQLCTGLMHRIEAVKSAAKYDHSLYSSKKPEPSFDELPPVTVEEYEALRERVSVTETYFNLHRLALQLQLTDHSAAKSSNPRISIENRFTSGDPDSEGAHLSVECSEIVGSIVEPMYAFRLASCASRQTDLHPDMLNDCYSVLNCKIQGLQSQLYLNKNCRTMIVVPCNVTWTRKTLIYPQYFRTSNVNHDIVGCEIDDITMTGTRAKLMLAASIASSFVYPSDDSNPLFCSSLFADACDEKDSVFLEIVLENLLGKRVKSSSTVSIKIDVNSIKAFALNGTQQAFVLSGPENDTNVERENAVLLSAILQYPDNIADDTSPPIISFTISEARSSLDPLLCQWLRYRPIFEKPKDTPVSRPEVELPPPTDALSDTDARRKIFRTLHESVHSHSDKDKRRSGSRTDWSKGNPGAVEDRNKKLPANDDTEIEESRKNSLSIKIAQLYPFWRKLVFYGSVGHFVVYVPTATLDGVGVAGIEAAKDRALDSDPSLHIFALKSPTLLIHSVNVHYDKLLPHLRLLPCHLPLGIWSPDYRGFPWTLKLNNLSCYTLRMNERTNLVRSVDFNATIDVTTKSATSEAIDGAHVGLGLCIYVDTSPIVISMSEEQIVALNEIASGIKKVTNMFPDTPEANTVDCPPTEPEATYFDVPKTPSSYNPVVYPENTTSSSSISTALDSTEQTDDSPIITAMVQWTIAKMSLKLYTEDPETGKFMKLLFELEDIITTFDWQPIYVKLKNKVTTATVSHFAREPQQDHWELGDYAGLIMLGRESSYEREDTGFLSVTYTKAQSGNVHTRWGAQKHQKFQKIRAKRDCPLSVEGYITEIDASLQRVDVILPPVIVKKFVSLLKPLLRDATDEKKSGDSGEEERPTPLLRCDNFDNKSLPLIYLKCAGMNLMVPTMSDPVDGPRHDLLMLQVDGISVTPNTENPICRTVLRSDIYQLAARCNILNVPGSSVEDRQYQVNANAICACTTTWHNYQRTVPKRTSQSYLYTMNENPALEWNNLSGDRNSKDHFSTSFLMSRVDVRLIIAPAIVLHPGKIICGGAFELTFLTDIDIVVDLDQVRLASRIYTEINDFLCDCSSTLEDFGHVEKVPSYLARRSSRDIHVAPIAKDQEPDFTGDSGIDFASTSVNYRAARKRQETKNWTPLPLEILVNCRSVTVAIHLIETKTLQDEMSTNEPVPNERNFEFPCFHLTMIEPNFYISQMNDKEKIQISCFDVAVSLSDKISNDPGQSESRSLPLIETKSGSPHPNTGIPPSFIVLKCERKFNTSTELFVNVERPTRFNCSLIAVKHIDRIVQETSACFVDSRSEEVPAVPQAHKIEREETKRGQFDLPELGFRTDQLVIRLETENATKVTASVSRVSGNVSRTVKSDKIHGNLLLDSLVVSSHCANDIRVFLNPSSFRIEAWIFWETWQDPVDEPQIKIQARSAAVHFEIGPQQVKMLEHALREYRALVEYLKPRSSARDGKKCGGEASSEQHYKNDLMAGAFQFSEGTADEIPSPYQVIFYRYPEKGMTWRYPQPRIITGLHVSPIPFEISDDFAPREEITCSLEYWSESHGAYRRHAEFVLSETESSQPDVLSRSSGSNGSYRQVASIWRVTILSRRDEVNATSEHLAPQALVGCLRVDSYFDPAAVPNLRVSLNVEHCRVSLCGHVDETLYENLTGPLSKYRLNSTIPETQRFAEFEHRDTSVILNGWQNGGILVETCGTTWLDILDYGMLHKHRVIESLEALIQITVCDEINAIIECNPVSVKFSPTIAHTIAVSIGLWMKYFGSSDPPILTRTLVANDTNVTLRFGQVGARDCVQLRTRECCFYHWRNADNRMLRVAIETANGWSWSQAFVTTENKMQTIAFGNSTGAVLFARIVTVSATQKLITLSASLVITNRFVEAFHMRLVELSEDTREKSVVGDEIFDIGSNDRPASIVLDAKAKNMAMRLRFATSSSATWTGDIPLKSNSKLGQPWLVKVPQDWHRFLSIWVRVVEETIHGETRMLVIMSPLYMIRSYLPVPVVIKIETPSLGVSSNATIKGQGKCQPLYCPGTFEHCHQLTFQFESSASASNPYVPLSYNSIEERTFFARPRNEDIDAILADFEKPERATCLPFPPSHPNVQISADQPQTHVQIKYRDAGYASSTLLLELQPWCFIFNTLGCNLAILAEDTELCQVPHNGIVTPPKLEGTFHLRVTLDNTDYVSPALQLARPDWNPGFYMPRIRGLVPVDGNIQASIECESQICVINVNSRMHEDMRVLRIMASHVLCNLTAHEFRYVGLSVAENRTALQFPGEVDSSRPLVVSPCSDRTQGIPIVQWRVVDSRSTPEHVALYISLCRGFSWSCPIRVDKKGTTRRCTAISDDDRAIPVVITTYEDEGTTYVLIHEDDHPQFYIENLCNFPILLGEANADGEGICEEASHFVWRLEVEPEKSCYYTTPNTASRMPDSQTTEPLPKLRLCALPTSQSRERRMDESNMWSRPINMSNVTSSKTEQYVRLPVYGDIKLLTEKRCHTIFLRVVCMSQIEVSAHDIRTRLILEKNKSAEVEPVKASRLANDERLGTSTFEPTTSLDISAERIATEVEDRQIDSTRPRSDPPEGSTRIRGLEGSLTLYVRGVNVTVMQDVNECAQRVEVASLCLSDLVIIASASEKSFELCACVGDLQLDNQMFEQGGFDFPVVFMSQNPYTRRGSTKIGARNNRIPQSIEDQSLLVVECAWEIHSSIYACTRVNVKIGPVSAYIEDTFVTHLLEYMASSSPPTFNVSAESTRRRSQPIDALAVIVPEHVIQEAINLRTPLRLEKITIEPISVLLSVHTSIRLYVALDHSPLYFGAFEREHLATTPGGLANALTMHYLSGALFGAGWVVGSLEILGSPGGFAQALGSGLKDFVTLPIQGMMQGPWCFLIGITQGSASLMKHLTAGTVNSVTKLASSVARNLDRLTLDDEHLQRQEESRRTRPQGMAEGLYQGLTGFGMSLLAAVAGLAHHPLQQVLSGVATPQGLVTGVGLGIVGAVTKPLSGAAELVALTGQGLLEGTGWNPLPTPRQRPIVESVDASNNSTFKCAWRLSSLLSKMGGRVLHLIDAESPICEGVSRRVVLVLTSQSLVIANLDEDKVERNYDLRVLTSAEHIPDPEILCLYCLQYEKATVRTGSPIEYPEMDEATRVRIEQFVRSSGTGCASFWTSENREPNEPELPQSSATNVLTFRVPADERNYFLSLFEAAKLQNQGSDFIVL